MHWSCIFLALTHWVVLHCWCSIDFLGLRITWCHKDNSQMWGFGLDSVVDYYMRVVPRLGCSTRSVVLHDTSWYCLNNQTILQRVISSLLTFCEMIFFVIYVLMSQSGQIFTSHESWTLLNCVKSWTDGIIRFPCYSNTYFHKISIISSYNIMSW